MRKLLLLSILFFTTGILFAQEKDKLKTEEIVVEKPYTPTITDAFKLNSNPSLDNASTIKKEKVSYSIFSIPVASTFTPNKGKAQNMEREPKENVYENYVSVGLGMYTSPFIEAYVHTGDKKTTDFGAYINHHSSKGGLNEVELDTDFSNTQVDLFYKQFTKEFNWQINAGVVRNQFNYYGLPNETVFTEEAINSIDEKQIYKNVYIGGKIDFDDSIFKGASVELENFSDDYNSNELRFIAKPVFEFPISTEKISSEFLVDIVSGKFNQGYFTGTEIKNSFFTVGAMPNFEINRDNLSINLGAKLMFSNDLERKENEFFAYPNVTASVKVVDDIFILVAGIKGDLIQNTYNNFASENPYVSPTLNILQTDQQYNAFVGAKGKLASNVGYNVVVSQFNEKNKPLYQMNETKTNGALLLTKGYEAGNSFGVVYDDVKTLNIFGEITLNLSNEFNIGGSINISDYTTTVEKEAWNLPSLTASISANYIVKKWFAGATLFMRGETKDYILPVNSFVSSSIPEGKIVKNEAFIDLNLKAGYNFTDQLSAFAKINNAFGSEYYQFTNYQVQPLLAIAGITYKFNFK